MRTTNFLVPRPSANCWASSRLVIALGLVSMALGCQDDGRLPTAPVHGTVRIDGKPLTSGTIIFTPERSRAARGQIGPSGEYVLSTYGDRDGAIVGKHEVAILCFEQDTQAIVGETAAPAKPLIPSRYAAGATSGLTADVKSGEDNVANFDLSSR